MRGRVLVVVGAQYGDEGKGKVTDSLAEDVTAIVRHNGGDNAGYTVVVEGETFKLHILPSGILRAGKLNIVGPAVAVNLETAAREIEIAKRFGSRVILDERAPIVLPIHRALDGASELKAGKHAIGTTRRGIGPVMSDLWGRHELPLGALRSSDETLWTALTDRSNFGRLCALGEYYDLGREAKDLEHLGISFDPLSSHKTFEWLQEFRDTIVPHIGNARVAVDTVLANDGDVLFEGVQGMLIDRLAGTSPYTTSSLCGAAGVSASFGIYDFHRVIGVVKAYTTRVGGGPFPTKLGDEIGKLLQERGGEIGVTTGRTRDCGWLDIPGLQHAIRYGGIRELVVTKLDILREINPLKICMGYGEGQSLDWAPDAPRVTPKYAEMPGWTEDVSTCRSWGELPQTALRYAQSISSSTGVPITGVGIGPERRQLLWDRRHR